MNTIYRPILLFTLSLVAISASGLNAQGSLTNGGIGEGTISPVGDIDAWTINCEAGVTLRVQAAELSGTNFEPLIRLYEPGGVTSVTSNSGTNSTNISYTTTVAGTYTVEILDASSTPNGTGNYRIYAATPSASITVPANDEGGTITSGEFYDGTIDLADMDLYSFDANAGETVRIHLADTSASSLDPFLILYGPNGSALISNSSTGDSTDIVHQAAVAGTYTVVVQDANNDVNGSGDYRLYFSQLTVPFTVPSGDEGGTVTSGEFYDGTIDLADMDLYSFDAKAGETVRIHLADTSASSLDPFLILYGPDGSALISNSSTGDSTDIAHQAAVAGTYTVVVQDANNDVTGSGDYRLYFSQLTVPFTVPSGDEGGTVSNGSTPTGTIDLADMDLYSFEANAGDSVSVSLEDTSLSGFIPVVLLYGPSGDFVISDSDSTLAQISTSIDVSGSYMLVVQDFNSDVAGSGNYELNFTRTPGSSTVPGGSSSGTISNGGSVDGAIGTIGDLDKWTFSATAGEIVWVQAAELSGSSFSPFIQVFSPGGILVTENSGTSSAAVRFTAPDSGTYAIAFSEDGNNSTGTYRIFLARSGTAFSVPSGDEGGTLENGSNNPANLALADLDLWDFTAQAGDRIWLQAGETAGSSFSPYLAVYRPDGGLVAVNSTTNSAALTFAAPDSGTYTVVAREDGGNAAGAYNLRFARIPQSYTVPVGDEGGTLESGLSYISDLPLADFDLWDFTAQAGDRIWLQAGETGGSSFSPYLAVYRPDGGLVAVNSSTNSAALTFAAPDSGTYTVVAREDGGNAAGTTRIYFARIPLEYSIPATDEGGGIDSGEVKAGDIALSDLDLWSFHAVSGDTVTLDLTETSGSSFSPYFALYGPDGQLVAVDSGTTTASISFIAPSTGVYFLVVREDGGNAAGSYSLTGTGMTALPVELGYSLLSLDDLLLSWPSPSSGWILEERSSLNTGNWAPSALTPVDNGFEKSVMIDTSLVPDLYFRLRKP